MENEIQNYYKLKIYYPNYFFLLENTHTRRFYNTFKLTPT